MDELAEPTVVPEGVEGACRIKGRWAGLIEQLIGGLRSGMKCAAPPI